MTTTGRNSTIRLAIIRNQIDQQQQVIAMLENRLQESILGGTDAGGFDDDLNLYGILDEVAKIYKDGNDGDVQQPTYLGLTGAMQKGVEQRQVGEDLVGYGFDPTAAVEQDTLRQLLYQARALLGELRVEEQHWNGEVNEEKQRRKELADFTKG